MHDAPPASQHAVHRRLDPRAIPLGRVVSAVGASIAAVIGLWVLGAAWLGALFGGGPAVWIAVLKRGFEVGSPPPLFAAAVISRIILVNIFPRFASAAPFLCLIDAHLLCPDIFSSPYRFGHPDHLRRYGRDYPERLREAGFRVEPLAAAELVGEADARRLGLGNGDEVFRCGK